MEMKFTDVFATVSSLSDSGFTNISSSSFGAEHMSITVIRLNGRNYLPWAKSVEVNLMAKGQDKYLIDDPPNHKDYSYAA